MKPEITYNLHDSYITSIEIGPRKEVSFGIRLYSVYYPNDQNIILRFGEIDNFKEVSGYAQKILDESDDEIGCGIELFQYDTVKESQNDDYWFYLQTSWCGALRIHCSKMTITKC